MCLGDSVRDVSVCVADYVKKYSQCNDSQINRMCCVVLYVFVCLYIRSNSVGCFSVITNEFGLTKL